jgi:hypothetical protein
MALKRLRTPDLRNAAIWDVVKECVRVTTTHKVAVCCEVAFTRSSCQ